MDKTPLVDLFERTDFNNVKELDCPLFPGLFDLYLTGPDFNGTLMSFNVKMMLNSTNVRIYFDKHLEVAHINWISTFLPRILKAYGRRQ